MTKPGLENSPSVQVDSEQDTSKYLRYAGIIFGLASLLLAVVYLVLGLRLSAWQLVAVAGVNLTGSIAMLIIWVLSRHVQADYLTCWLFGVFLVDLPLNEAFLQGATPLYALSMLVLLAVLVLRILPRRYLPWVAIIGLAEAGVFYALNVQTWWVRFAMTGQVWVYVLIGLIVGLAGVMMALTLMQVFRGSTIRARLLLAFTLLGILPILSISFLTFVQGWQAGRQAAVERLTLMAQFKGVQVEAWVDGLRADLYAAWDTSGAGPLALYMLDYYARVQKGETLVFPANVQVQLEIVLKRHISGRETVQNMMVLSRTGQVVGTSNDKLRGWNYSQESFFRAALEQEYTDLAWYLPGLNEWVVMSSLPIRNDRGESLGVLVACAPAAALDQVLTQDVNLGKTGEVYLVGLGQVRLTGTGLLDRQVVVNTQGFQQAILTRTDGWAEYANYVGSSVVGAYRWLPDLEVALLVEQRRAEAFADFYGRLVWNSLMILVSAVLTFIISRYVIQSISIPLADLAQVAGQVAAGDWSRTARTDRHDEIGAVAQAFNQMTGQLREAINSLEARVAERTQALEQRSNYLAVSSEVGRVVAAILDTEQLIREVVELIRDRFGLSYVGLFLTGRSAGGDQGDGQAVLHAAAGEQGWQDQDRGRQVQVGQGSVGEAIAQNQACVATDIAALFGEDGLSGIRSEAAVPLRAGGQVVGALLSQSRQSDAFNADMVLALQTVADQVAAAWNNAQLFAQTQQALESARQAYGQVSREAWSQLLRTFVELSFRSDAGGVDQVSGIQRPEIEEALREGKMVRMPGRLAGEDGAPVESLAIPIRQGDQVIGVLDTFKPAEAGRWTSAELAWLQEVTEQLAFALERARLYQESLRRSIREQQLREIGTRMQSTVSLDVLMQRAIGDLARALNVPQAFVQLSTRPRSSED